MKGQKMALEHSDIRKMLEVAVVAARLAGQRAMEELKYIKTSIKNGNEIVTQADGLCQKLIIDRIKETYPDHGFLAEEGTEGKMLKQSPRAAESIWWVIDPIDGTNNYSHSFLSFAVSIAALYEGKPVVGVIFDPATESMYTAAKDMDAQLNSSKITVSDEDISEFSSFGIDSHFPDSMKEPVYNIMSRTRFRNLGTTALHLAYIARGSLIGCITTMTKIWDVAAGALIIEAAGGKVVDLSGNNIFPMELENYTGENSLILAANKKAYPELQKLFGR